MSSNRRTRDQDGVRGSRESSRGPDRHPGQRSSSKKRRHPSDHGNFQDYYHFRGHHAQGGSQQYESSNATILDARVRTLLTTLRAIHPDTTAPQRILDLGCNQGRVGIQLGQCREWQGRVLYPTVLL